MTSIALLRQMIKPAAQVALDVRGNKASVELHEPQAPDSKLRIRGLPAETIVIKIDCFPSPDALFGCHSGECKRADYAIVAASEKKRRILYLELKRTKADHSDVVKQLQRARCVMLYCEQIASAFRAIASTAANIWRT